MKVERRENNEEQKEQQERGRTKRWRDGDTKGLGGVRRKIKTEIKRRTKQQGDEGRRRKEERREQEELCSRE